ncbi:MAG: lysophospholipid acyltransferase family protein [Roseovarius sp.]
MSILWNPEDEPELPKITLAGWIRVALRGVLLLIILLIGVSVTAILRLIEVPFYGLHRPWSPTITQIVCRLAFVVLRLRRVVEGQPMTGPGAVVANHTSWLDIFTLNAHKRIYFVSKDEVANWPGIGLLARITGTVFIARDPKAAKVQTQLFEERLKVGHRLLFFPEGTSTDGMRVLPFKTTLFQAFFTDGLRDLLHIQPVSVIYQAPPGQEPRFYGWWGDMDFAPHLLQALAARRHGAVTIKYHTPVAVADFANRKALAKYTEDTVRAGMPEDRRNAS